MNMQGSLKQSDKLWSRDEEIPSHFLGERFADLATGAQEILLRRDLTYQLTLSRVSSRDLTLSEFPSNNGSNLIRVNFTRASVKQLLNFIRVKFIRDSVKQGFNIIRVSVKQGFIFIRVSVKQ